MSGPSEGGIEAEALLGDARDLAPDAFRKRHGEHFLLGAHAAGPPPAGPRSTMLVMETTPPAPTAALAQRVYPLRRTARSIGAFVSVGRTANNDVAIVDSTVSRFHAFVRLAEGKPACIQDAGSTNGTTVNGQPVPTQGEGEAVPLKPGDDVRIGSVDFTYLDGAALQEFLRMMG
jgi:hypothetical protein